MSTFAERMLGASKFDVHTYEEVEADTAATGQALGVVMLSSIAAGIGWAGQGARGIVMAILGTLIAWFLWGLAWSASVHKRQVLGAETDPLPPS